MADSGKMTGNAKIISAEIFIVCFISRLLSYSFLEHPDINITKLRTINQKKNLKKQNRLSKHRPATALPFSQFILLSACVVITVSK
jgi:hypothetical protein